MTLIIGGRGQGKLDYALRTYGVDPSQVSSVLSDAPIINCLESIIKTILNRGGSPMDELLAHAKTHPHVIYICDEVGSGVVPMRRDEHDWREAVGRCCVELASRAERVERVFCGIPMVLKPSGEPS